MEDYKRKYEEWKEKATDKQVAQSLADMEGDDEAIREAFYKDLEFGTGGLRGIMSAGTARMNIYTVRRTTEGLAKYMLAHGMSSCAVTYDSRNNSKLFAQAAAAVLASMEISVIISAECMPTPFLSFMTRHCKCDMGINITASHNPKEYNGYKVYDNTGCQLTDSAATEVIWFVERAELFNGEPDFENYINGKINYVGEGVVKSYIDSVLRESLGRADGLVVTYTPLNGVGYKIVPEVLRLIGAKNINIVPEQSYPNGDFITCPYPNPEKKEALTLSVSLAEKTDSDVVIATDPDSDRLGVAVKHNGKYVQLSGNEVGVLLLDYILLKLKETGALPPNPIVVKTVVTTPLVDCIAKKYGAEVRNVLTGFKYIGDVINKLEREGRESDYVFGFEESCGYLKGTYARDKDGVVAAMLFVELAAEYKRKGKTAVDRLSELEREYGVYSQLTVSYRFDGIEGENRKNKLLDGLRASPITNVGASKVIDFCDFETQTKYDLPRSNVMRFNSDDGSQLIIRPSGTEPLVKCYIFVCGTEQSNAERLAAIKEQLDKLFN